jgi:CheY-like chemotaxis protein
MERLQHDLEGDGYLVLRAVTDDRELLGWVEGASPDLVVLEARPRGLATMKAMRALMGRHPRVPVLVVSPACRREDPHVRAVADACVCAAASGDTVGMRRKIKRLLNPHAA